MLALERIIHIVDRLFTLGGIDSAVQTFNKLKNPEFKLIVEEDLSALSKASENTLKKIESYNTSTTRGKTHISETVTDRLEQGLPTIPVLGMYQNIFAMAGEATSMEGLDAETIKNLLGRVNDLVKAHDGLSPIVNNRKRFIDTSFSDQLKRPILEDTALIATEEAEKITSDVKTQITTNEDIWAKRAAEFGGNLSGNQKAELTENASTDEGKLMRTAVQGFLVDQFLKASSKPITTSPITIKKLSDSIFISDKELQAKQPKYTFFETKPSYSVGEEKSVQLTRPGSQSLFQEGKNEDRVLLPLEDDDVVKGSDKGSEQKPTKKHT